MGGGPYPRTHGENPRLRRSAYGGVGWRKAPLFGPCGMYTGRAVGSGAPRDRLDGHSRKGPLLSVRGRHSDLRHVPVTGGPMSSLATFRVTIQPLEDSCVMRAAGEIDMATADTLR